MQSLLHRHTKTFLSALWITAAVTASAQTVNKPRLDITAPEGTVDNVLPLPPAINVNSSELFNYVRSFTPRIPVDDPAQLSTATPAANAAISTLYKDGFNRGM